MQSEEETAGELFRRLLHEFLGAHPGLAVDWVTDDHIRFPKSDESGFDVDVYLEEDMLVVSALGVHEHFDRAGGFEDDEARDSAESALSFLRDLLGPTVRLREKRAGNRAYRHVLERRTASGWEPSVTTSALVFNYLGRRTERMYQNTHLQEDAG